MANRNQSTWLIGPLLTLTLGASLLASVAHPQAIGASAKTTSVPQGQIQAMQSQIQMMQGQVQALVARVKSLEDQAQLASGSPDDTKPGKSLEKRLEVLEREQAKESAHEEKGGDAKDRPEKLTVVAPFTVVDEDGKTIMRVGEEGDGGFSRGIYAYDQNGKSVAHMGSLGTNGRLYAMKEGSKLPDIMMAIDSQGAVLTLFHGGKKQFELDKESLAFYGDGGSVLSLFGTKNRVKGFLQLSDSNGDAMVEAGVLDSHKGYVLASPYEASVDPHGDPSVLKGGKKK